MKSRMNNLLVCCVFFLGIQFHDRLGHVAGSQIDRLYGVPASKNSLYPPDRDFECLDGSLRIPFTRVNDDYCDCADGSDEPGTSACSNGSFYCKNSGHKSANIPSAWVNDRICDCCDGSDEYLSDTECKDNCHELGREALLEAQKAAKLVVEGNKIRLEMIVKGKQLKNNHHTRLTMLRADSEEMELTKKEKEIIKNQAEERERIALEKYKPIQQEQPPIDEGEEVQEFAAEDYFKLLDSDNSGTVTVIELQTRVTFDKDRDGAVSEEEALYFLNNNPEIALEEFVENAWANIKPFLMMEQGMFKPADQAEEEGEHEETHEEAHEETHEVSSDGQDRNEEETLDHGEEDEKLPDEPDIIYDEETQALIDEAAHAKERYQEAEKAATDVLNEVRRLEEKLERDYGPEEEFSSLDGECFEHTDLEYIYSLCMFGRASQRSKSGGSDVNLGHFHEWVGPEGNKYAKMKYDRGLTCWNGPARSVIVSLICGTENKLISVSEPSRCEYAMELSTPALCNPGYESDTHDEL
ncbi:glucosidase 2 subunit beta [Prorops nasuta]|uniref:glucosidase 2 subunit beta n=1 Tax=Prorops nasuta TaxID=863751 RepID=UPI0034CE0EEF